MRPRSASGLLALLIVAGAMVLTGCSSSSSSGGGGTPGPGPGPAPEPEPDHALGLDARPANLACLAPSLTAEAEVQVELQRVFAGLSFSQPLAMMQAPDSDGRWYVLEKGGRVRAFANQSDVTSLDSDFISLQVNSSSEGGLLGMAFHPEFATNRHVYLSWTEGPNDAMVSVVARFTSLDGGLTLDPGSQQDVIRVNQDARNHNGGQISFGPDGLLYFGLGDGGGSGDPNQRGQDTTNLHGAMLRLDVNGTPAPGAGYAIPADNPFAGNNICPANHSSATDCPEIFAWGLRNPWRWSFDAVTGTLWVADVGQNQREEINHVVSGGNYGWNCREGLIAYSGAGSLCAGTTAADFIDPVFDYPHSEGQSITGGFVYRGSAIPGLYGQYVYGDFVNGRIWRLVEDGAGGYESDLLISSGLSISSFGVDNYGELYVVDLGGTLHRIVPVAGMPGVEVGSPVPAQLSATGCVVESNPSQASDSMIPYAGIASSWFDGASRERWFAVPDATAIAVDGEGRFVFPERAVLMEHFRLNDRLIETRLLMHHPGGTWAGYSYEWNAAQTDAQLLEGGKVADVEGQQWQFPSSGNCMSCHRGGAGVTLGLELGQLNHDFLYALTGRTANQLATLDGVGYFGSPIGDPQVLPTLADPYDEAAPLIDRARSWLHVNCAHCHGGEGNRIAGLDLRHTTLLENTGACGQVPQGPDLGLTAPLLIDPGEPVNSVLLARLQRRDANAMPPLGTLIVDAEGAALIGAWIEDMTGCVQ